MPLKLNTSALFFTSCVLAGLASASQDATSTSNATDKQVQSTSVNITVENGEVQAIVNGKRLSSEETEELMGSDTFILANNQRLSQEEKRPRAMLGIRIAPSDRGVLISEAIKGTPAAKAGLREGDLIIKVNGKAATRESLSELISKSQPGKSLNLMVARGDKQERMKVKLAQWNDERMNPSPGDAGGMLFEVNGDEDMIFIELEGDEAFDEEMLERMIMGQLAEQLGDEAGEEMFEHIRGMVMDRVHMGMDDDRGRNWDDDEGDEGNHPERMFHEIHEQMEHMRHAMEEQLHHAFEVMDERFNEGGEMVERAMMDMHEQFQHAGNQIRQNFEKFGDTIRQMREDRERIAQELDKSHHRQRELSERIERLEAAIGQLMNPDQPRRKRSRRGQNRDED